MEIEDVAYMKPEFNIAGTATKTRADSILLKSFEKSVLGHQLQQCFPVGISVIQLSKRASNNKLC